MKQRRRGGFSISRETQRRREEDGAPSMEPATNLGARPERQTAGNRDAEPSLVSSFEQLMSSSQAVVTKRIDLALLEAQELIERSIERVALLGVAVVLATGMWFAAAWAVVVFATPPWWTTPARLAVFAAMHAAAAGICVALATRQPVLPRPSVQNGSRRPSGTGPAGAEGGQ